MNILVKEILPAEFDAEEQKIRASHKGLADLQESWKTLDQFFRNESPAQDRKFYWTYFRVYVDLTNKLYSSLDVDTVAKILFGRQIPMTILMDIDPVKELLWYLSLNAAVEQDAQNLYVQVRRAFVESAAILGTWKGEEVTIAEIVKEFFSIKQRGSDALGLAEFNSKLKELLFPKNDPLVSKYVFADPDTAIYRFVQLMLFFYVMEPKDIWYAVDAFMHPEIGATAPEEAASVATVAVVAAGAAAAKVAMPVKREEVSAPVAPKKEVGINEIKRMIEAQFKKDAAGQFADVEGVFAKLGELAEKYHDPKITEMVYFDEKDGRFKWSV